MAKTRAQAPKTDEASKPRYLQVRVTEPEKAAFDEAAEMAGIGVSAWVRERLRIAARTELQGYGKTVSFIKK